jgi:hypothetical protein
MNGHLTNRFWAILPVAWMVRLHLLLRNGRMTINGKVSTLVLFCSSLVLAGWKLTDCYVDFNSRTKSDKVDYDVEFQLPLRRSAYFIGRDDALNELHRAAFSSDGERDRRMTKTIVVTGTGGIGKSQLVIEFIHMYREKFQSVLWISCASEDSILNGFEAAALELKTHLKGNEKSRKLLTDFETAKSSETKRKPAAVQLVQKWLSQTKNSNWLVVFDGLDTLDGLRVEEYLPETHAGHVIITSRNRITERYAKGGPSLRLELLSPQDAISLLLQRAELTTSLEKVSSGM